MVAGGGTSGGELSEEQARARWREFIDGEVAQLPALPSDAWPVRILSSPMFTQWRAAGWVDSSRAFDEWLPDALPWAGDTPVVLTASATQSIETTWAAFARAGGICFWGRKMPCYGVQGKRLRFAFSPPVWYISVGAIDSLKREGGVEWL